MKANKDGGTSVGFSKVKVGGYEFQIKEVEGLDQNKFWLLKSNDKIMNKECEHEWVSNPVAQIECSKCGQLAPRLRDFKVMENIDQINKQEWEDILKEFEKENLDKIYYITLLNWLEENYLPPQKKNT